MGYYSNIHAEAHDRLIEKGETRITDKKIINEAEIYTGKKMKHKAEIKLYFSGRDKEEVSRALSRARALMIQTGIKATTIKYDLSAHKDRKDEEVKKKIIDLLAVLSIKYKYDLEEIEEFLEDCPGRAEEEINSQYEQGQADQIYDQMKEEEAMRG